MPAQKSDTLFRLEPPLRGLAEESTFQDQPQGTTRRCKNVRGIDCATGIDRIAQRPGTALFMQAQVENAPIKDIGETVYDEPRISFADASPPTIDWAEALPGGDEARAIATDLGGDVYVVDGTSKLCVFNASGTLLKSEPIPLVSDGQIVRCLFVDRYTEMIFVAVSDGGIESDATLWAYRRDNDDVLALVYTYTVGEYIERLRSLPGKLYALQNKPSTGRSAVVAYGAYTVSPRVLWRRGVRSRAYDFDVRSTDGAFVVVGAQNFKAGQDPRYSDSSYVLFENGDDFSPEKNLRDYKARAHSRLNAASLEEQDDESDVTFITDATGNGRSVTDVGTVPPTLRKNFLFGRTVADFTAGSALRSAIPTNQAYVSAQKALIPIHRANAWAMVLIVRLNLQKRPLGYYGVFFEGMKFKSGGSDYFSDISIAHHVDTAVRHKLRFRAVDGWEFTYTIPNNDDNTGVFVISFVNSGDDNNTQKVCIRINGVPITSYTPFSAGTPTGGVAPVGADPAFINVATMNGSYTGPYSYDDDPSASVPSGYFSSTLGGFATVWSKPAEFELCDMLVLTSTSESYLGNLTAVVAPDYPTVPHDPNTITEIEVLEGWAAWSIASAYLLDDGTSGYPHPFRLVPPTTDGQQNDSYLDQINPEQTVVLYDKDRKVKWVTTTFSGAYHGGLGYACAFSSDGAYIYTLGGQERASAVPGDIANDVLNKLDATDGSVVWSRDVEDGGVNPGDDHPYIAVDAFDNVWIPRNYPGEAGGDMALWGVDKDGADIVLIDIAAGAARGLCVALPPSNPDYTYNATPVTRPEFVYLGTTEPMDGEPVVHRVRVVDATLIPGATRIRAIATVTNGNIRRIDSGVPVVITGGEGALQSTARFVQSVDLFGERFYTDGMSYKVYNPALGTVVDYRARSTGEVPPRCQLIATWRGAIALARSENDPQNWHISRRAQPYDWNLRLVPETSDMAVSGNSSRIGRCPDIINTIIPWNDDLVLFGGDKSVWRLTGDPMSPNSSMDDLNLGFGLAFGQPHCRDGDGRLWVISNHGSLYVATPSGGFKNVSEGRIDRRMQEIDFSTHHVRLEWDFRQKGIYIIVAPFGANAGDVTYFLYDHQRRAFWPDDRVLAAHRAHSLAILNADRPQDRKMLFGLEGGYVATWSETAAEDMGQPIDSRIDYGPTVARGQDIEVMTIRMQATFDPRFHGARVRAYASNTAVDIGEPVVDEYIEAGEPDNVPFRARGKFVTVSVGNAAVGKHWAVEGIEVELAAAGPRRNRK